MKILIACEYSGTLLKEFRLRGQEAYSCDLRDYEGDKDFKDYYIKGDCTPSA